MANGDYKIVIGTFIDNKFIWHDVDSFDTLPKAYKAFKKYVESQLKYSDEELKRVWDTGRLDIELRKGKKLLNWIGVYAREVDKKMDEELEEEKAQTATKDSVEINPLDSITYSGFRYMLETYKTLPDQIRVIVDKIKSADDLFDHEREDLLKRADRILAGSERVEDEEPEQEDGGTPLQQYEVIYDIDDEDGDINRGIREKISVRSYEDLRRYLKDLKEMGGYNIDVTFVEV